MRDPYNSYLLSKRDEIRFLLTKEVCPNLDQSSYAWWPKLTTGILRATGVYLITSLFAWSAFFTITIGLSGFVVVTWYRLAEFDPLLQLALLAAFVPFAFTCVWILLWYLTKHSGVSPTSRQGPS
jgi:hypothetical protein